MDRWTTCILLGGATALLAAGCSHSDSGADFKSFKDLPKADVIAAKPDDAPREQVTASETAATDTATTDAPDLEAPTPVSALAPVNVVDGTSLADVLKVFPGSSGSTTAAETPSPAETAAKGNTEPKPQGIQLLVPHKEFKVEGPQNALRVSYDDFDLLKVLNMEPVPEDAVKHFPSWLKALDGQRIRVRGFMYPTFDATGIDQFVLARDNQICCFGRNPKVYDLVSVQMRDGVTTDYIQNRPFDVVGTFRIDLIAEGGKPMGLYWLEDSVVINK